MNNPLVSIIIANYNGQEYLETCLSSILSSEYTNFEIYLIDDGSSDSSVEIINKFKQKEPRIKLIQNTKNQGASASRNRAAKVAKGDVLVFLDNDTEVTKDWLNQLLTTLFKSNEIAATQSLLLDFRNRNIIQNAGVSLWAHTAWGLPKYQWKPKELIKNEEEIIAISACLAVKKDVFILTQGFDEQEAVVTEDLDLSWRIWLLGYKILVCPNSIVYHHTKPLDERKNLNHNAEKIYFHLTKNSFISIIKNYQAKNSIKFFLASLAISYGRALLALIKRKDKSAILGTTRALIWFVSTLSVTITKRNLVQKTRKVNDQQLFQSIIINQPIKKVYNDYFTQTGLL